MKYWVQYLTLSTGYIEGTIPPRFAEPTLIDACGDTGVIVLDGRNSKETMRRDALRQAQRLAHWRRYPAYVICQGPRLFEETRRSSPTAINYPVQTN